MVGLSYKGVPLALPDEFPVPWEVEDDIFDLGTLGQGYSWPVKIPRKGNEQLVFQFAGDPQQSKNRFRTYDGFAITKGGNLWWNVSFVLENADDHWYEGSLTTIESSVQKNKNKLLSELITLDDLEDGVDTDPFDCHFYNDVVFFGGIFSPRITTLKSTYLFRLIHKVVAQLGYRFVNDIPTESDLHKLSIFQPRTIELTGNSRGGTGGNGRHRYSTISEIPTLTVGDLLFESIFHTSGSLYIDTDKKLIQLSIESKPRTALNLTGKLSFKTVHPSDYASIRLAYADISPLDEIPVFNKGAETRQGTFRGEFNNLEVFELNLHGFTEQENDIVFITLENCYFQFVKDFDDNLFLRRYAWPFDAFDEGEENPLNLESKLVPVHRSKYTYMFNEDTVNLRNNGSGSVRLKNLHSSQTLPAGNYVTFIDKDNLYHGDNITWYLVFASQPTPVDGYSSVNYMDIALDYDSDIDLEGLYYRINQAQWMPILEASNAESTQRIVVKNRYGYNNVFNYVNKYLNVTSVPRVLYNFGIQSNISGFTTYNCALPSPYLEDGTQNNEDPERIVKIGEYSTNTQYGGGNIYENIWKPSVDFINNTRKIVFDSFLTLTEIKKLFQHKYGRWEKGTFRLLSIKSTLGKDDREKQEVTGYITENAANESLLLTEEKQGIDWD